MSIEQEFLKYVYLLHHRGHLTLLSGNVSMRAGDEQYREKIGLGLNPFEPLLYGVCEFCIAHEAF